MTEFNFNELAAQGVIIPGRPKDEKQCANCSLLKKSLEQNKQLQHENETILSTMEFILALTALREKVEGRNLLTLGSYVEFDKELAERKEQVRTLFNNLVETGEPAFVECLFGVLNIPKDFQQLI